MGMTDFAQSPSGRLVEELLGDAAVVARMEELSRQGRPAVGALDEQLAGKATLANPERQWVGRRVRDVMRDRGWRTQVQRRVAGGKVLTSGAVYARAPTMDAGDRFANIPSDLLPVEERVRRAQELVRRSGITNFSVDDYLEEKWAESAAEERRWQEQYGEAAD
ncbi:hypothetical protein [uncultured Sphingomonas sp.]|uniref:hypothetical protein n=1 Tax=uncultured Sphingomonas sp. TaxID=158754 RepID=UPI0035CA859D